MYLYSLQINIRNVRGATSLLARWIWGEAPEATCPFSWSLYKHHIWSVCFLAQKISPAMGAREQAGVQGKQHNKSVSNIKSYESQKQQLTAPLPPLRTSSSKPVTLERVTGIESCTSNLNDRHTLLWLIALHVCCCCFKISVSWEWSIKSGHRKTTQQPRKKQFGSKRAHSEFQNTRLKNTG